MAGVWGDTDDIASTVRKRGERSVRTHLSSFLCFHSVQDSSLGDGTSHIPHRTSLFS